ncbi:uncharacterized protein LOC108088382 isoform X2 [Drosophila ficusphila]|uniref:uncharacterized protein LOC108088382 isoform X2 n=1 Tax=Drosophila ficusphila TaxID=30025 RepID=UPI0007E84A76|nr:uncharacterized protein LOC108088382 isoform X2 [Drosophila ficusphila]
MSRLSNSLSILFLAIQCLAFGSPAPTGNPGDISDRLVTFEMTIDRHSDLLLPELELLLLQAEQKQDDLEVVRMQLLQLNLMKLLIALDCFILLCIYFYAKEDKYHQVQAV